MDAQYPFASRDDLWRVFDELKDLHAAQFEQAERIARLERRRDEDARLKSVWGPLSPFPSSVGGTLPGMLFSFRCLARELPLIIRLTVLQNLFFRPPSTHSRVLTRDNITAWVLWA